MMKRGWVGGKRPRVIPDIPIAASATTNTAMLIKIQGLKKALRSITEAMSGIITPENQKNALCPPSKASKIELISG